MEESNLHLLLKNLKACLDMNRKADQVIYDLFDYAVNCSMSGNSIAYLDVYEPEYERQLPIYKELKERADDILADYLLEPIEFYEEQYGCKRVCVADAMFGLAYCPNAE